MEVFKGKKYFESPALMSYKDLLAYIQARFSNRPAVRYRMQPSDETVVEHSYQQMVQDVERLAKGLVAAGEKGGRVAVVGDNSYPWMLSYLASVLAGSVIVPLDRLLPKEELALLVKRGEVSTLIGDASLLAGMGPMLKELSCLERVVLMQEHRAKDLETIRTQIKESGKGCLSLEELLVLGDGQDLVPEPLDPKGLSALLFTSGTTDSSKAVMLSQENVMADVRALLETVRFVDPIRTLSMLPLHHTFENTCGFLTILALGGCIHIYDGLRYISKNIKEYKVHMLIGVPTVFEMVHKRILQTIEKEGKMKRFKLGLRISKLLRFFGIDKRRSLFKEVLEGLGGDFYIAISGAAALDVEVIRFFDQIGISILQGYGLTETSPVAAGCNTQANPMGTVGAPLSGIEMAIDNDEDGMPGEILVRGPIVMQGYYQNEEANQEAFDADGWFHTGDIGVYNAKEDSVKITGRLKSMIVLNSGKKVFPEELERLLNQNAFIKDSLVFGHEESNGDVVISAKLVLDKEAMDQESLSQEGLVALLSEAIKKTNALLPSFKGIRGYAYSFQEMIKTTTLKVRRGVETANIKALLEKHHLSFRELTGKNLDHLEDSK